MRRRRRLTLPSFHLSHTSPSLKTQGLTPSARPSRAAHDEPCRPAFPPVTPSTVRSVTGEGEGADPRTEGHQHAGRGGRGASARGPASAPRGSAGSGAACLRRPVAWGAGPQAGPAPTFPSAARVGTPAQPRTESGVSVRLSAAHVTERDKHTLTEVVASPPAPHRRCFLGAWPTPGPPAATPPPGQQGASGKLRSESGPPAQELPTTGGSKYELLSPA